MTGGLLEGEMLALSSTMALIKPKERMEVLANIRLEFPISQDGEDQSAGDLYAKAVEAVPDQQAIKIRFTAVPEDVAEAIRSLCTNSG